jgi:ubiquinone/menaquinone biosynthesis C-methylase UbiE
MFEVEDDYWWFRAKRALVKSLLRRYVGRSPARLLDLGCGTGGTLQSFATEASLSIGAERSDLALGFCRERGLSKLVRASAERLPFRADSIDLLLCLDVLYHRGVVDDRAVLVECFRILRGGGITVITDSALPWLSGPHDEAVHARKRYRLGELTELVRAAGFRVLKQSYANSLLFLPAAGYRLARRWLGAREARSDLVALPRLGQRLLEAVMAAERWLLRWVDLPIGTSIVVVAEKP